MSFDSKQAALPEPAMRLSDKAFTLAELMISAGILIFVFASLLLVFVNCILLNELNRNISSAYSAIGSKMEEIKNTSFANVDSFNGQNFALTGFISGSGRITVSNEAGNLKRVRIVACFMSRNRLIGDNINSCSSSPVELITLIAR